MTKAEATEKWLELIRPYHAMQYELFRRGMVLEQTKLYIARVVECDRCVIIRVKQLKAIINSRQSN